MPPIAIPHRNLSVSVGCSGGNALLSCPCSIKPILANTPRLLCPWIALTRLDWPQTRGVCVIWLAPKRLNKIKRPPTGNWQLATASHQQLAINFHCHGVAFAIKTFFNFSNGGKVARTQ